MSWSPTINLPIFPSYLFFLHPCLFGHVFDKSFGSTWPWHTLAFSKKSQLLAGSCMLPPNRPWALCGHVLSLEKMGAPQLRSFQISPWMEHSQKGWFLKGDTSPAQVWTIPSLVKKLCSRTLGLGRCQRNPLRGRTWGDVGGPLWHLRR